MTNKLIRRDREREARTLFSEDRTHNRPTFDSFPALLPYTQNFFGIK